MLSDRALQSDKTLAIVRVAFHAVAGHIDTAISELVAIDTDSMTLGIAEIVLPIDQLPVFEALYDMPEFQEYAKNERPACWHRMKPSAKSSRWSRMPATR
jgi:hypothetical protein